MFTCLWGGRRATEGDGEAFGIAGRVFSARLAIALRLSIAVITQFSWFGLAKQVFSTFDDATLPSDGRWAIQIRRCPDFVFAVLFELV